MKNQKFQKLEVKMGPLPEPYLYTIEWKGHTVVATFDRVWTIEHGPDPQMKEITRGERTD